MADESSTLTLRVRLVGGTATEAQLVGVADATKTVGTAAKETGDKEAFAAEKSFLFGESMYSLRRYAFYALTAIGATGAGILKMGYDFDEASDRAKGALSSLVGGTANATTEVARLVQLTHTSGLGLSTLATATQQMLTFGFSVKATNRYMEAFANYAGRMGLGANGLSSLTSVFNKIQSQGFMNSREFNELQSALGIPATKILTGLAPQLGYSKSDLQWLLTHNQLEVTSGTAMPAIAAWLNRYAAQQPKTTSFDFSVLRSYLSQITGALGRPVFNWLDRLMAGLTKAGGLLDRLTKAEGKGGVGGFLNTLDPSGTLLNAWKTFAGAVQIVWGDFKKFWTVAGPIVGLLFAIAAGVLSLTSHLTFLKLIVDPLVGLYFIRFIGELGKLTLLTKAWTAMVTTAKSVMAAWAFITDWEALQIRALYIAEGIASAATWVWTTALYAASAATYLFGAGLDLITGTAAVMWTVLLGPVGLVIAAVALIGFGFYELYTRVGWFRNIVNETWSWIKGNWPMLLEIIAAPFTFGLSLAAGHIRTIWNGLKSLWSWIDSHIFHLHFSIPGLSTIQKILGFAQHPLGSLESTFGFGAGANHTPAQLLASQGSLVGTLGIAKLAQLDSSAGLTPTQVMQQPGLSRDLALQIARALDNRPLKVSVQVNEKEIANAAFKGKQDAEARR